MTATPTCQPWCDNHQDGDGEPYCNTIRRLYTSPYRRADASPEPSGFIDPDPAPDAVILEAIHDLEADATEVAIENWDFRTDELQSKLWTDLDGIKAMHAALGQFIKQAESSK
ncbi:hypothetical protein LVY72_12330 [Arthrobacter sp. I2-34]|uniref:Uncharacterized protein n=1 Tax=Arthrobacter hankyongi TaxID=2904801 RepID=A0ABS9L7P2_9MICC|nr:hypothetical protein [Arthrobacter hankyongi]MCG2622690.1 hypothetical protein [Arthrobacter hankyongi]